MGAYLTPIYENIPATLRPYPQWVCWCAVNVPGQQKPRKIGLNPGKGYAASTVKPESWGTFDQAVARCRNTLGKPHTFRLCGEEVTGIISGVGFVLSEDDPFCGVDLDNCVDDAGNISPEARAIVDALKSYTEISPSGTGLRIFVRANKGATRKCRSKGIETYHHKRFLTVTGHLLGRGI